MKPLVWILGIGGVLYLLDTMGYFGTATATTTTAAVGQPVSTGGTTTTTPQAANPVATPTLAALVHLMQQNNQDPTAKDYSQYVYQTYYNLLAPGSHSFIDAGTGNATTSITNWWSVVIGSGIAGLGMIAHHVNPYLLGPRTNPLSRFGNLAPTGIETYIKRTY